MFCVWLLNGWYMVFCVCSMDFAWFSVVCLCFFYGFVYCCRVAVASFVYGVWSSASASACFQRMLASYGFVTCVGLEVTYGNLATAQLENHIQCKAVQCKPIHIKTDSTFNTYILDLQVKYLTLINCNDQNPLKPIN